MVYPLPGTEQQEYLIPCRRHASCVHAGGLSQFKPLNLDNNVVFLLVTQLLSKNGPLTTTGEINVELPTSHDRTKFENRKKLGHAHYKYKIVV